MLNKQNQFFYDKGKCYFGKPNGCAIQYIASEWEESTEIEFGTPRFGFKGRTDDDCIYLEFDLMQLEAQCLFRLAREMQTRIRANFEGKRFEIDPSENVTTIKREIRKALFKPEYVHSSLAERFISIFV